MLSVVQFVQTSEKSQRKSVFTRFHLSYSCIYLQKNRKSLNLVLKNAIKWCKRQKIYHKCKGVFYLPIIDLHLVNPIVTWLLLFITYLLYYFYLL